jgi:hypothetical protein
MLKSDDRNPAEGEAIMADNTINDAQAYQHPPEPSPDLRSLDRLVGTWKASDPSGAGAINGQTTFEWMEGRFFLIQHVDFDSAKGIEIIGHERLFGAKPSEDIKSRFYSNTGDTLDYVYELEGDTLTIWSGEKGSPAYARGTFSDDGNTCSGAWHYPDGGGYWWTLTRVR